MTELPGNRETAYRVFAAEFDDATVEHQESDEERAPNYVITPTGARVNRLFAVGVLTEVEAVNDDVLRARIVDPTGAFVVYAGQYQPDEMAALERLDPPEFVAITGKARTFSPDDSDRVYSSIRPESINTVDADTRDRWVVRTAEHTVERVGTLAAAATLDATGDALRDALEQGGLPAATASGSALALERYGTTPAYLAGVHDLAVDAARVVAGEIDEAEAYDRAPSDAGDGSDSYAALARDLDVQPVPKAESATPDSASPATDATATTDETTAAADAGTGAGDADSATGGTDDGESEHEEALEATAEVTAATTESATDASLDGDDAGDESVAGDAIEESVAGDAAEGSSAGDPDDGTASDDAAAATASEPDADDEGVGDFEPSEGASTGANTDEMYEFDEDEREAIEEEYGTDFASGNDVPDPGESDLDAPDPEEVAVDDAAEADADDPDAGDAEDAAAPATEPADETGEPDESDDVGDAGSADAAEGMDDADDAGSDDAGSADAADDVDLDAYVLETMRELDDGDGAARDELVERVVEATDASADDVEAALQDALMGGQCYEPDDDVLKPI